MHVHLLDSIFINLGDHQNMTNLEIAMADDDDEDDDDVPPTVSTRNHSWRRLISGGKLWGARNRKTTAPALVANNNNNNDSTGTSPPHDSNIQEESQNLSVDTTAHEKNGGSSTTNTTGSQEGGALLQPPPHDLEYKEDMAIWKEEEQAHNLTLDATGYDTESISSPPHDLDVAEDLEIWKEEEQTHNITFDETGYDSLASSSETTPPQQSVSSMVGELADEEVAAETADAAEDAALDTAGYIDGTEPIEDDNSSEMIIVVNGETPEQIQEDGQSQQQQQGEGDEAITNENSGWTGEGQDLDPIVSPPAPSPPTVPAAPTPAAFSPTDATPTTPQWNEAAPTFIMPPAVAPHGDSCSGLTGLLQCHPFASMGVFALFPLFCLCLCRRYSKSVADTRGQYRAVAAQYGDVNFDNTFSDAYSDDEEDEGFSNGNGKSNGKFKNGDIESDDSWGKSGQRTLEMTDLGKTQNDDLDLEEMNG